MTILKIHNFQPKVDSKYISSRLQKKNQNDNNHSIILEEKDKKFEENLLIKQLQCHSLPQQLLLLRKPGNLHLDYFKK